jgi:hypothetical protein
MLFVSYPNYYCACNRSGKLRSYICPSQRGVEISKSHRSQRDGWIQVSASAKMIRGIYADEHSHRPAECNDDPAAVISFCFI